VTARRSLERTAYHEAGHAVASFALNRAVRRLSVVPGDNSEGRVLNHELRNFHPDYERDARTLAKVQREIMILLAGGIAQAKFQGHRRGLGTDQDFRCAYLLAEHMCDSDEESEALVAWLHERTRLLLNRPWHWRAVQDIARELLGHRELSGRAARRIFTAAARLYFQEQAAMDAAAGRE
jgi:hypothetical protein